MNFLAFIDPHIQPTCNVRTGNVFEDLCKKLMFIAEQSHYYQAETLIGGDIFDRPTIPDVYKSYLIDIFKSFYKPPICIPGNHSILWNSREYDEKTSYNLMVKADILRDLNDPIDFGTCILTTGQTIETFGKPHIHLFHGFLNVADQWAISFDNIHTQDECYLILGHDHVVYDPVKYCTTTIFRPGSLLRGIRADAQNRTPQLLLIHADSHLSYQSIDIPCRDYHEIFKTKEFSITQSEKSQSYEDVIALMSQTANKEMTMEQALSMVTDPSVIEFATKLLDTYKLEK